MTSTLDRNEKSTSGTSSALLPRSASTSQFSSPQDDDDSHLLALPDAILTSHILPFLGPKFAIVGLGCASRRLLGLATDDRLWRAFWFMRSDTELARLARGVAQSLPGLVEGRDYKSGIQKAHSWQSDPPDDVSEASEGGGGGVMNAYRDKLLSTSYPKPTYTVFDVGRNLSLDIRCDYVFSGGTGARSHLDTPVTVWCCWPDCQRARCREECPLAAATVLQLSRPRRNLWRVDPKFYTCSWCRVTLCGGCAHPSSDARLNEPRQTRTEDIVRIYNRIENCRSEPTTSDDLVRQCDACGRGACLDCEKIVWLGPTRRCSSKQSFRDGHRHEEKCETDLCWRCSWKLEANDGGAKDSKGPIHFASSEDFKDAGEVFCESCCRGKWKWMLERRGRKEKSAVDAEPKSVVKKARV